MAEGEQDFFAKAKAKFPFLPERLLRVYIDEWAETGSQDLALAELRRSPQYEQFFPGNKRDDGTVRLTEFEYLSVVEGYRQRVAANTGLNPDVLLTTERIANRIQQGVSPDEFGQQIQALQQEIVDQGDQAIEAMSRQLGADRALTEQALFARAFDELAPDGTTRNLFDLTRQISAAQISTEAERFGFGFLDRGQALEFQGIGLGQEDARRVFGEARVQLPRLNELAERFNDPGDPLTLDDFTRAVTEREPEALAQVERLMARRRASFSPQRLFPIGRGGGVPSLR